MRIPYHSEITYAEAIANFVFLDRKSEHHDAPRLVRELYKAVLDCAPSGDGFDGGTTFLLDDSKPNKLVFETSFHHFNEHGDYTHWSHHKVIVTPSFFAGNMNVKVTGGGDRLLEDYVAGVFYLWLATKTKTD